MDADTLLVGSPLDEVDGEAIGSVFVFRRDEGGPANWGLVQRLEPREPAPSLGLRRPTTVLAGRGDRLVLGSYSSYHPNWSAAWIFEHHPEQGWVEVTQLVPEAPQLDPPCFGGSAFGLCSTEVFMHTVRRWQCGRRSRSGWGRRCPWRW